MKTNLLKVLITSGIFLCSTPFSAFADDMSTTTTTTTTRTMGNAVDDQALAHSVNNVLKAQLPEGSFTVASYGKEVLLAGQVPTAQDKTKAELAVSNTAGVGKVWNYLTVGENEDTAQITQDAYLTSAAKTRLVAQKGVNANNIKVVTSDKVVYLLGSKAGKRSQIKAAIVGIKGINDVSNVIDLINK